MRRFPAVVLSALLIGGCSHPGPQASSRAVIPETRPAEKSIVKPLTKSRVHKALLRAPDMPTGWSKTSRGGGGNQTFKPTICGDLIGLSDSEVNDLGEVTYGEAGAFASSLDEDVYRVKGKPATSRLDLARTWLAKCPRFTTSSHDGFAHHRLAEMSFPGFGDDTVAIRDRIEYSDGDSVTVDRVLVSVHGVVTRFYSAGTANPLSGNDLEQLVRVAVKRLG